MSVLLRPARTWLWAIFWLTFMLGGLSLGLSAVMEGRVSLSLFSENPVEVRPDTRPLLYWAIVLGYFVITALFLWQGIAGWVAYLREQRARTVQDDTPPA